ncbi:NACHT domain-containing protein [Nodosilinea sp. PGN35]|uniref:NACHT domain-containing protein n=1 Tax=Nodosilinea sp. PGN35 TaxID=3020489 RepID=UPI0023B20976|nr:NACHT domain-containing NTPase [Nodosilinea sp. TSF1-S3]MDF0366834.1 NACHT domain-containing NTPase [Nodosilinea sp. TSF1-S3]
MQSLPADFLKAQAKRYDLSPEQTEALIKRLGDKDNEQADADTLHISVNALRSRMTGVYTKFRTKCEISQKGPGKLRELHDCLLSEYRKVAPAGSEIIEVGTEVNALVKSIRAQVHDDIQSRCGTMHVLDMEQPIGLDDIYTHVNILKKLSRNQQPPGDEWLKCDPENFDRFLIGHVRQPRVHGLQAVEEHSQLMILGKPGAGKTTFLKRLAILCNQGEFQPQRVPVFVTLKEYADDEKKPKLQTYIQTQWQACGVKEAEALTTIQTNCRALVLLDGLDEVSETDHDRVLQDIKTFAHQFRNCQCVITCRTAVREYIFGQFTEVEVADFNLEQITEFATKWFVGKNDPEKAKVFIKELNDKDNKPIRALAVTPILLALLCLAFEETSEFPRNRSDFYRQGTDWLLSRWDDRKGIRRDLIYKRLSLPNKKKLLSHLAFETFEQGNYFFKQVAIEQHIIRYICDLPGANNDDEALQLDGEAVLKSIESQNGLLIKRARGIYSFSHLTFQEYFTAQHIINSTTNPKLVLQNLAAHITEERYREVFLLSVEMLPQADTLLTLMKLQIDCLLADNSSTTSNLQLFLDWVKQKATSAKTSYRPAVTRAFYFSFGFSLECYSHNLARSLDRDFEVDLDPDYDLDRACDVALDDFLYFSKILALEFTNAEDPDHDLIYNLSVAEKLADKVDPQVKIYIQELTAALPDRESQTIFKWWWRWIGPLWVYLLRTVMITYRDIGYDWEFSDDQVRQALQYYRANQFLIECLNSNCYVTKATRQYIEDTLLLPLSEIEKYPVPDAIVNL